MTGSGTDVFAAALADLAEDSPAVVTSVQQLTAPVSVAVDGLAGAGVATVSAALRCAGWPVTVDAHTADLAVWVLTETARPEDRAALGRLCAAGTPVVPVLNKADLVGLTPGGPLSEAYRHSVVLASMIGAKPEAMVALLAVAALDPGVLEDTDLAALRLLCEVATDLSGPDAFLAAPHPLTSGQRRRLLERLDVFGIAHAVVALRSPAADAATDLPTLRTVLRAHSGVDGVVARLAAAAAPVRYRRMCAALTDLAALAVTDAGIAAWLTADRTVLAQMTLAVAVVQDAGMTVDPADDVAGHLRRAVQWRHYALGPVDSLHRSCGSDIVRGSLRLWANRRRCR
jgi:hypothetical protein